MSCSPFTLLGTWWLLGMVLCRAELDLILVGLSQLSLFWDSGKWARRKPHSLVPSNTPLSSPAKCPLFLSLPAPWRTGESSGSMPTCTNKGQGSVLPIRACHDCIPSKLRGRDHKGLSGRRKWVRTEGYNSNRHEAAWIFLLVFPGVLVQLC